MILIVQYTLALRENENHDNFNMLKRPRDLPNIHVNLDNPATSVMQAINDRVKEFFTY